MAPPPAVGSAAGVGSLDREALGRVGALARGWGSASPAMVTWPVLLRQAPEAGTLACLRTGGRGTLRPSVTVHRHGIGHRPEASPHQPAILALGRTPPQNGVRALKLRLGLGSIIDLMRACPSAALCRRCRVRHWPAGRAWRLGGWRRCIHPPVAPSLSFWCPPLSVRGAPHQPGEPYRRAAATLSIGQTSCSLAAAAASIGFLGDGPGSGALGLVSSSHARTAVAKGHLSRKAMAVACAAPGV